jgi:hypothetical protein
MSGQRCLSRSWPRGFASAIVVGEFRPSRVVAFRRSEECDTVEIA